MENLTLVFLLMATWYLPARSTSTNASRFYAKPFPSNRDISVKWMEYGTVSLVACDVELNYTITILMHTDSGRKKRCRKTPTPIHNARTNGFTCYTPLIETIGDMQCREVIVRVYNGPDIRAKWTTVEMKIESSFASIRIAHYNFSVTLLPPEPTTASVVASMIVPSSTAPPSTVNPTVGFLGGNGGGGGGGSGSGGGVPPSCSGNDHHSLPLLIVIGALISSLVVLLGVLLLVIVYTKCGRPSQKNADP